MKGRWEKVWNMGNILWNYSTWPMGEWGIYCKVVPYWNSRGNSLLRYSRFLLVKLLNIVQLQFVI
ncbi:hypothetical protein EH215_01366 [Phocaeicola vulgatus]|jgi:hypothetical protein|uniref:Uncharacterized protein n=1 Tax=Phocaeicola vulgatus TaxID=821 RepID=A0A663A2U4_PHOVU|nr:hypothetical protein EH214_01213 [Phocaeicola vulgatus]TSE53673.1 hypothetical protein EH215_01366 [Phocaeicola vulgatus]